MTLKILYIATSFPAPSKGATIYTDLAEALYEAGHEITVAVAEQAKNKKFTELKIERGFEVLRVVTGNYYDVGIFKKGITSIKIPIIMRKAIYHYFRNKNYDLILFESPPVTTAKLVAWAKKVFNCPAFLMLKDIFPQNAVDLGIIKRNSLLHKYFRSKEQYLYKVADHIGCMSPANIEYVIKHNKWLNPDKVCLFPNTKKISESLPLDGYLMRKKYGIPEESFVFMFGGNMGKPQYIELLCEAIIEFRLNTNLFFLCIGRGTERYKLEDKIKKYNIKNAMLLEDMPRNEYEQITRECDVGLAILHPDFTIPNFPSRILSYMEYAKPVLAATDKVTDIRTLIEEAQCGEWVWSRDIKRFTQKIEEMSANKNLIQKGLNARNHVKAHYSVENSVKLLEIKVNIAQ